MSNDDVRIWLEGVGAGMGDVELDLVLAGSVDTGSRRGKLELAASGEFATSDGIRPAKFEFFRRSNTKVSSPLLLVNLAIHTQIEYNYLVEGYAQTVEGRQNTVVSNWGYFPYIIRLEKGEVGAPPIVSPVCPLAIPRTARIKFKMNRQLAITELKGRLGGQNIFYTAP